jgi:hypothetical protein
MVPHTERSNTASFLEEVLKYIDSLKSRVIELELALQAARANAARPGNPSVISLSSDAHLSNRGGVSAVMKQPDSPMRNLQLFQEHLVSLPPQNSVNPQNIMNVGYTLQQLQQQQLQQQMQRQQQMQLQQHHEAALAALREEQQQQQLQQQQQQQATAILAVQQLRQQELTASRQSNQLATLANRLGLKTLDLEANMLSRPIQQMALFTSKSEGNSLHGHNSNVMHGLEALIMGQQHRLAVSAGNAGPSSTDMPLQLTPLLPLQIPSSAQVEAHRPAQSGSTLLISPPPNPTSGAAGSGNVASAETHVEDAGSLPQQQQQESSSGATASAEPADASPSRKRRALIL